MCLRPRVSVTLLPAPQSAGRPPCSLRRLARSLFRDGFEACAFRQSEGQTRVLLFCVSVVPCLRRNRGRACIWQCPSCAPRQPGGRAAWAFYRDVCVGRKNEALTDSDDVDGIPREGGDPRPHCSPLTSRRRREPGIGIRIQAGNELVPPATG